MSTKKTIKINPELFKIPNKTKTRRNVDIKMKPNITPNALKTKLLKRIKNDEVEKEKDNISITKDDDEFSSALTYITDISKLNKQKQQQQKQQQQKQRFRTLKNYDAITNNDSNNISNISLELPMELQEPQIISQDVFKINYKPPEELPYGCLKGGKKKTYKEWKQEQEQQQKSQLPDIITTNHVKSEREIKLEQIRNKLKQLEQNQTPKMEALQQFRELEKKISEPTIVRNIDNPINIDKPVIKIDDDDSNKQYVKRTLKRRFVLGKNDNDKCVSVLIKDKHTRKNIIDTQKELKKTNINDIKKYLRQHGIIKVGSTCPPDILRKTFEQAILTGEVNNTNKEVLLHNMLH